jgi:hypothetical protein
MIEAYEGGLLAPALHGDHWLCDRRDRFGRHTLRQRGVPP